MIIGIDPGSRITGYGIVKRVKSEVHYIAHGVVKTKSDTLADKLNEIFVAITQVIHDYQPTCAAIEQVFTSYNHQSALKLGQARGAAMTALAHAGLAVDEYSAKQVKQAVVGYGGASKSQVQHMVRALLKMTETPVEDAADALAIAICHCNQQALKHKLSKSGV
ncbi:MAG: crossover junction endodeoxyribonuclease RuvC [Coxiella sp. (in: Bacteria)]|nr:MAG: crossover junction endodeoxyribonuclease RuvC [Coxiella sp. (in: g-proteobacteria)]